jgi:hypothetical protein
VRELTIAALSIAVGAAIQVSGFGGTTAVLIAWASVAMILIGIAGSFFFRRQGQVTTEDAALQASRLGRELVHFVQTREAIAPSTGEPARSFRMFKSLHRSRPERASRESFDHDTMDIFQQRFAERVIDVTHNLRSVGRIGAGEYQNLVSPQHPTAIEVLGRRLIELGYREDGPAAAHN